VVARWDILQGFAGKQVFEHCLILTQYVATLAPISLLSCLSNALFIFLTSAGSHVLLVERRAGTGTRLSLSMTLRSVLVVPESGPLFNAFVPCPDTPHLALSTIVALVHKNRSCRCDDERCIESLYNHTPMPLELRPSRPLRRRSFLGATQKSLPSALACNLTLRFENFLSLLGRAQVQILARVPRFAGSGTWVRIVGLRLNRTRAMLRSRYHVDVFWQK
jgi:hypothetical protein